MKKELHTVKEVAVKTVKRFGFVAVLSVGLVGCSSEEPVKKEETKQSQEVKKEVKESEEVDKQQEEAKQREEEVKKAEAEKVKQQQAQKQQEDVKTSAIALDDSLNIHKSKVAVIVGYIEDEFTRADLKDSAWRQGMHVNLASLKRLVVDMPNGGVAEGKQNDYNRYYNIMEKLYYCSQTLSENISNGNQELFERAKTNFIDVAENEFKPLGK
ncbi:hypothetical protein [Bacillus wiedmannii]|uniref:hypothetical protein n=1 Tax=Bacillus wiedmannii TaxID=1890302 RepID=UPI000BF46AC6|nr:hypothetical protein [Bacillus wiedmannii]PFZ90032.1 hypothetical protein COL78_27515 [Bacillus wiedmannii]